METEYEKKTCAHPGGVTIKFFGEDLDPCDYVEIEKHTNVTVHVLRRKKCGHVELEWFRTDNTESWYKEKENEKAV